MKFPALRFTLRESLLATLALAALLGWWVNMPRWDQKNTQFYQTFNASAELKSEGVQLPMLSMSRGGGVCEVEARIDNNDDPRAVVSALRKRMEAALKSEAGVKMLGGGHGSHSGYPNFEFKYRKDAIAGVLVCRTFATSQDRWTLYILIHEVSMK